MKYLLWALVVAIVVMWLTRSKKISSNTETTDRDAATKPGDAAERMVRCAHCGVYLPASESITSPSGKVFCSEEHRLQHVNA